MGIFDNIREALRPYMITCRAVNRFLADYLDGTLDARTRARFEAHLQRCPNCDAYLEQYRMTIQLVKEDQIPDPPPELADRTLTFLRAHWDEEEQG
jgi:anti-sigma factor RsiW